MDQHSAKGIQGSSRSQGPHPTRVLERSAQALLWNGRWLFAFAALACLLIAVVLLWISMVDTWHVLHLAVAYTQAVSDGTAAKPTRVELVGESIKALDGFLLAMAMLIFSLGIYELFVSEIDQARAHALSGRILLIRSLDDLKSRLGKVILVIMVVTLFEAILEFHVQSALDLLGVATAIVLAAAALYLSHLGGSENGHD